METDRGTKSILRAIDSLNILAENPKGISLADLSHSVRMPKSTLYRILNALAERQLVRKDEDQDLYYLGYGILRYSNAILENIDLIRDAHPILEELNEEINETIHLGILDPDSARIVYVDKLESTNVVRMVSRMGQSVPLHCTSLGKAYLSVLSEKVVNTLLGKSPLLRYTANTITDQKELLIQLEQIRQVGYAVDMCENEPNVICIGVPIKNREGKPLAAISISAPSIRITKEDIPNLGQKALTAARKISEIMSMMEIDIKV